MRLWLPILLFGVTLAGCGTTRWSDTQRTATEQLLISDAIDRSVSEMDFSRVAGKHIYLDTSPIKQTIDASYLISTLRQHLLATGCVIRDKPEEADYTVEVRAGAVGTDRRELLFGVPATRLPVGAPGMSVPAAIPEIALATRTEQRAVAKLAVFVYNRRTGRPVWQSGIIPVESKVRDIWVLGVGPFQRGTIYDGTSFAGQKVGIRLPAAKKKSSGLPAIPSVAKEAYFFDSEAGIANCEQESGIDDVEKDNPRKRSGRVTPAGHTAPAEASASEVAPSPVAPGPTGTATHHALGRSVDLSGFEGLRGRWDHEKKSDAEKAKAGATTP